MATSGDDPDVEWLPTGPTDPPTPTGRYMKTTAILSVLVAVLALTLPACVPHKADGHEHEHEATSKLVVTSPLVKDVEITQPYVCLIRSRRTIEVRPMQEGYLEEITDWDPVKDPEGNNKKMANPLKEGQAVKAGDVLFRVVPALYKATLAAEMARADVMRIKWENADRLHKKQVVSDQDVALAKADYDEAKAKVQKAQAELQFTCVRAPFDCIIDRFEKQQGSFVKKEDVLTTLYDNDVMWVYFYVPEARYFEYEGTQRESAETDEKTSAKLTQLKIADARIELELANGKTFRNTANDYVTVLGKFNNETGNIGFRADFKNDKGLLRNGQTGTVKIKRTIKNATVIPQRATFEVLDKLYVFVVGADHIVHRRQIDIEHEQEDIFVIKKGLEPQDKIILEGIKQVNDGKRVGYDFVSPEDAVKSQKNPAE